ncbi:MipA/OmpV family protein [Alteriqipengyuania sp.]
MFAVGGYSRMIGDAADSPFVAQRGSADQWLAGAGLGYTF